MRLAQKHRRAGFTLVEIMVAAALTILIMTVMATGFQMALQSFSHLKSASELADRIRTAETMLRLDLEAPHFDSGTSPGVVRLSDFRFDLPNTPAAARPTGGFVQIRQGAASTFEGVDQDGLSSTLAQSHGISMTVRRSGKSAGELFAAPLAPEPMVLGPAGILATNPTDVAVVANTHLSEWAEVHWFLDTSRPTPVNGVNTFPLMRRVRLLTPTNQVTGVAANNPTLPEVVSVFASGGGNITTNNLTTIATPANRLNNLPLFGAPTALPAGNRFGDDIVITNVLSFEVKPTWEPAAGVAGPRTSVGPVGSAQVNADFPFDYFPPALNATVFDTALGGFAPASGSPVTAARVTGVQIKIRVYDGKNKMTRQSAVTGKL